MELNWDNAKAWEEKANEKKEIFNEPKWSWEWLMMEKKTFVCQDLKCPHAKLATAQR